MKLLKNITLIIFLLAISAISKAQTTDISHATIICFEKNDKVVKKSVTVLQEEVAKRTGIQLPVSSKPNKSANPVIYIGLESQATFFPANIRQIKMCC